MKKARKTKAGATPRAKASASAAPVDLDPDFEPVVKAFARDRRVGIGKMFSSKSVLNVDGKIFAMFVKGSFVAKLPKARVDEMVAAGVGRLFDPGHGRLMKEWISIDEDAGSWVALAREARAFVGGGAR
jgi:hypothetical protein